MKKFGLVIAVAIVAVSAYAVASPSIFLGSESDVSAATLESPVADFAPAVTIVDTPDVEADGAPSVAATADEPAVVFKTRPISAGKVGGKHDSGGACLFKLDADF